MFQEERIIGHSSLRSTKVVFQDDLEVGRNVNNTKKITHKSMKVVAQ
jgi:hypothetical protein